MDWLMDFGLRFLGVFVGCLLGMLVGRKITAPKKRPYDPKLLCPFKEATDRRCMQHECRAWDFDALCCGILERVK